MAQVIVSDYSNGSFNTASSATFGGVSNEMQLYLNNQISEYKAFSPVGFTMPSVFDDYINNSNLRNIDTLRFKINNGVNINNIIPLSTIEELQNAPDYMIPYIMAEPSTAVLYNKGYISGYKDNDVDYGNDGRIGNDVFEYRQVTDMMAVQNGKDVVFTQHIEAMPVFTPRLSLEDKVVVLSIWERLREHHSSDDDRDITSPWGGTR